MISLSSVGVGVSVFAVRAGILSASVVFLRPSCHRTEWPCCPGQMTWLKHPRFKSDWDLCCIPLPVVIPLSPAPHFLSDVSNSTNLSYEDIFYIITTVLTNSNMHLLNYLCKSYNSYVIQWIYHYYIHSHTETHIFPDIFAVVFTHSHCSHPRQQFTVTTCSCNSKDSCVSFCLRTGTHVFNYKSVNVCGNQANPLSSGQTCSEQEKQHVK